MNTVRFQNYRQFEDAKLACRLCWIGHVYDSVVRSDGCTERPRVVICGEAPGADEVAQGKAFVGRAGKILRDSLNRFGFRRHNALITNIIPCRPERNEFPSDDSVVRSCMEMWLIEELKLLKPDHMLLLGSKPLRFVLGMDGISRVRGQWFRVPESYIPSGSPIMALPTFHPSYVARMEHAQGGAEVVEQFNADIRAMAERAGILAEQKDMFS